MIWSIAGTNHSEEFRGQVIDVYESGEPPLTERAALTPGAALKSIAADLWVGVARQTVG